MVDNLRNSILTLSFKSKSLAFLTIMKIIDTARATIDTSFKIPEILAINDE